uniref:FYR N-terminal domain-containing protein n=1 Tax=Arcella intermedia TaxID=1963864 RepID=A0A6B2L1L2_9EUKA
MTQKEIPSIEKYYTLFLSTCRKIIEHKDNPELVKDDLLLSAVQAKRALERVAMFNALRRQVLALPEKEMEQLLTGPLSLPSVLKRSHLPDWWEPYKHDMGLVRGIDKFGFGKWEEVFTEPSFNLIVEKKKAEFGEGAGSLNGVLALPQDKVFMKRINYIIKIASGGKSLEKAPSIAELEEKHTDEEIEDFIDEEEDQEAKVGSKRKRGKAKPTSLPAPKRRKSNEIRRDPTGKVIFPIELGVLTIDSLGTISLKKSFHTEKYIWPVGYRSRREYTSSVDINKRCEYICEIQDVDDKPVFVVTDPDDLQNSVHANSASSAWKQILDRINLKKSAEVKRNSVSGPEYFGFGVPLIADLISKLPNADQCARFGHKKERKRTPSQILAHKEPVQETGEERPGPVPLHPTLDPEEIPVTAEPVNIAEYQQAIENSTNEHFVPTILYRPGTLPQIKTFNQLGTVNVPVIDANIEVATPIRNGPLPRYAGNHPQMAVLPQIYYGEHLQSHHTYHPQHPKT